MTPFMPWLPLLGTIINCILISQLSITSIMIAIIYFGLASLVYFLYGLQNSKLNNKTIEFEFTTISDNDNDDDEINNPINDYDNITLSPVIINTKRF